MVFLTLRLSWSFRSFFEKKKRSDDDDNGKSRKGDVQDVKTHVASKRLEIESKCLKATHLVLSTSTGRRCSLFLC